MNIPTENEITGAAARRLREGAGLSQGAFWAPFGITQSGGCRYEGGAPIPKSIRTLIFATYIGGLKIDASTEQGAAAVIRLGHLQASEGADEKAVIGKKLQTVMGHVRSADAVLKTV